MIPDCWLVPFLVFEYALSVFDCDMTSDHGKEDFAQKAAKASRRRIGALVVQFGCSYTRLEESTATAVLLDPRLQRKSLVGFP